MRCLTRVYLNIYPATAVAGAAPPKNQGNREARSAIQGGPQKSIRFSQAITFLLIELGI